MLFIIVSNVPSTCLCLRRRKVFSFGASSPKQRNIRKMRSLRRLATNSSWSSWGLAPSLAVVQLSARWCTVPTPAASQPLSTPSTSAVAPDVGAPPGMGKKKLKRLKREQEQQQLKQNAAAAAIPSSGDDVSSSSQISSTVPPCSSVTASPTSSSTATIVKRVVPREAYSSFRSVVPINRFRESFQFLQPGQVLALSHTSDVIGASSHNDEVPLMTSTLPSFVKVGGRVVSMRDLGKMLFITIRSFGEQLQICARVGNAFTESQLQELKSKITTGDIIGVEGLPGKSKKGELSLFAESVSVLAPYVCTDLTVVPDQRTFTAGGGGGKNGGSCSSSAVGGSGGTLSSSSSAVSDPDIRYRYRFVDMITDPTVLEVFKARHRMINQLRQFLNNKGFIEVETPMFHTVPSGANAKPFSTHHNANDTDLFLRVAPELHLKQCVVGGMDLVYEIGRVFRNEDSDKSHNPEFTSCEFYAAYHTYEDLMLMTEALFRDLAISVRGEPTMEVPVTVVASVGGGGSKQSTPTPANAAQDSAPTEWFCIDLTKPFHRVSVYDAIQEAAGVDLPPPSQLDTPTGIAFMAAIMLRHNIQLPSVRTASKFFDKLIDHFITDHVVEPTFVCDHPLFMSPLAKEHANRPGLSERFELFINGMEVCNSYSELSDPQEQLKRFEQQLRDKHNGDDEAMNLDETFLKSLQTGMPPTAGWGMGIDRMVMLLTKKKSIRDVIVFPLLRPDDSSHDLKRRRKTASFFGFSQQTMLFCLSALEAELARRGQLGMKTEHLKVMRQTVLQMNRRRNELELELERCRDAHGDAPCGVMHRLLYRIMWGGYKH